MVREGFAYGGQGRRDFQEQYGVLETVEKVESSDNACSRATKKTVRVLRKPGASPLLFGKFLMNTTAFLALEDISDNLPCYDESVISVDMDEALQQAYERLNSVTRFFDVAGVLPAISRPAPTVILISEFRASHDTPW